MNKKRMNALIIISLVLVLSIFSIASVSAQSSSCTTLWCKIASLFGLTGKVTAGVQAIPGDCPSGMVAYWTGEPLFSDDFNDGNADGWTQAGGTWSVANNEYVRAASNVVLSTSFAGDTSWTNYAVEAKMKSDSLVAYSVGLAFRVQDTGHYYSCYIYNGGIQLWRHDGPGISQRTYLTSDDSLNLPVGTYHTVRAEASGSTLKCYLDGVLKLTATDSSYANGKVGLWVYDPGNGYFDDFKVFNNIANDALGVNNGQLINGATYAAGKVGQAFQLSGSAYVNIPDSPSLDITGDITLESWVYNTGSGTWQGWISKRDDGEGDNWGQYGVNFVTYTDVFQFYGLTDDGTQQGDFGYLLPTNQWNHVVVISDSNSLRLYVNGALQSTLPPVIVTQTNTASVKLGASSLPPGSLEPFQGLMDEVAIYNRALTPAEISDHYNSGNGKSYCAAAPPAVPACGTSDTQGLVSYWQGEDNLEDYYGNFDTGTWKNGAASYDANGKVGKAFSFTPSKYIEIPDPTSSYALAPTSFSIEYWVKPSNNGAHVSGAKYVTAGGTLTGSGQVIDMATCEPWSYSSDGAYSFGQWYHVVQIYDNAAQKQKLYVNGEFKVETTTTITNPIAGRQLIWLGVYHPSAGLYLNGLLDEVAIYNRPLTQAEITDHYTRSNLGQHYCTAAQACTNGEQQDCPLQAGVCEGSYETCANSAWPGCTAANYGANYQTTETTCDGMDNDCDGSTDEGCPCSPYGGTQSCSVTHSGICAVGTETCGAGGWTGCPAAQTETCNNLDDNCNSQIDDGLGSTTCGVGACIRTVQNCLNGQQQTCTPLSPGLENTNPLCSDNIDNDCDGMTDFPADTDSCTIGVGSQLPLCETIDANGDGNVDILDAVILNNMAAQLEWTNFGGAGCEQVYARIP